MDDKALKRADATRRMAAYRARCLKEMSAEEITARRAKEVIRVRKWCQANPDKVRERARRRVAELAPAKAAWRARNKGYHARRYASDPVFALWHRMRNRMRHALKSQNGSKVSSTAQLLGCSDLEFQAHIERQFLEGMSWDNRSKWHIDHIKPCAGFDLTKAEQQRECFHFTNLRPLWAVDNLKRPKVVRRRDTV